MRTAKPEPAERKHVFKEFFFDWSISFKGVISNERISGLDVTNEEPSAMPLNVFERPTEPLAAEIN